MEQKPKVGIVAALRREIAPLVRQRRAVCLGQPNRRILIFESDDWVAGCGGIGKEAAQATAKVLIDDYCVSSLISCGLAGGLASHMKLAQTFVAGLVIDATSGKAWSNAAGAVTLVSFPSILGPRQKRELASKFSAQAVDMEAAAVAEVAAQAGVPFVALKSISDELDFPMPPLQRFIKTNGRLAKARLLWFLLLRPWHWQAAIALARNSRVASLALTQVLRHQIDKQLEAAAALESK